MRILAFAGSNSSRSINLKFARHALAHFEGAEHIVPDLNEFEMPLYSIDREKASGFPEPAHRFITQIKSSDGIILSLAEHNRSFSAAFKTILDWCSRIDGEFFSHKPMLLLSTSPGSYGGGNVMAQALGLFPKLGAEIVANFSLPAFGKHFAEERGITDPALHAEFMERIEAFRRIIRAKNPAAFSHE